METRIQKHKQYRIFIFKQDALSSEEIKEYEGKHSGTFTTTLPLQDVIDTINEDEQKDKLKAELERRRTIKLIISVVLISAIALGLIIFAIVAFGRIN